MIGIRLQVGCLHQDFVRMLLMTLSCAVSVFRIEKFWIRYLEFKQVFVLNENLQ